LKKLGGIIVSACILAALAAAPAHASATPASAAEAQELCRKAFAADRCESLASQWANVLETKTPAQVEDFARQLLADVPAGKTTVCRAIFSDQVCDAIEGAGATVWDIVNNPPTVDDVRYIILWLADCVVHQTCIAIDPFGTRASEGKDIRVCREVFSDGICSRVEDPVGTVVWLYDTVLRCYLDPACTPTPNPFCNQFYCLL
jgi:hypothetical protein